MESRAGERAPVAGLANAPYRAGVEKMVVVRSGGDVPQTAEIMM